MGTGAFDASLVGFILITPIFLGSIFLLIDIPIFNPVNPLSIVAAALGLCLGLVFGLFAGRWYTNEQLRILIIDNEFKGLGSKKLNVAVFAGLAIFLIYSFFTLIFDIIFLGNSLVLFVVSATFTGFLARMVLIKSWERREERIVLMEWNKFYVIPKHPPQY
jgi:hypothetical protein